MILVPAGVDGDVKGKLYVKVYYFLHIGIVGLCGPYYYPGSRCSRWGCERQVRYKGIICFIHCHGWSLWFLP